MTTELERTIADRHRRIDNALKAIDGLRRQMEHTWPGEGSLGHVAVELEQIAGFLLSREKELDGQDLADAVAEVATRCVGLCAECAEQPEAEGLLVRIVTPAECEVCEGEGGEA